MTARGTAPLSPLPLVGPAFRGLNTELVESVGLLDSTWALVLQNVIWGRKGKPETRKGYVNQTSPVITGTPTLWGTHEVIKTDQTTYLVAIGSNFKFYVSTNDGVAWSDITGAVVTTSVKWKFLNFNGELYATAPGHRMHRYTGAGVLTELATSPVTNGVAISAFGRLWAAVDASGNSTLKYCALLDGTDWTGSASGSVDVSNAWTNGFNTINALAIIGASFVIFGETQILIYVDGAGSKLGIDPNNMYVVDTIEGTGTIHRDSIITIGVGDLWYLGPSGIQSLARVVADKTNPLVSISNNVYSLVKDLTAAHVGSVGNIKGIYHPSDNMALFIFPQSSEVLYFDTKAPMEDGTYRCAEWVSVPYFTGTSRKNKDLVFGLAGGKLAKYSTYRDNAVTPITMYFASPWMDFGESAHNLLKIMKEASVILYGLDVLTGVFQWAFDFRPLEYSTNFTSQYVATGAEYGSGEYGIDEYGSGLRNRTERVAMANEGQYVKVYFSIVSNATDQTVVLQEITLFGKPGRLV